MAVTFVVPNSRPNASVSETSPVRPGTTLPNASSAVTVTAGASSAPDFDGPGCCTNPSAAGAPPRIAKGLLETLPTPDDDAASWYVPLVSTLRSANVATP